MILLYLISILCSLVLFAPDMVPMIVKWPVAVSVVLLVVFFFNLKKKDTIYTTHPCGKKLHAFGLFNPLILFLSASLYVLGFSLIITHLQGLYITDFIKEFKYIVKSFEFSLSNGLFCGLVFVLLSVIVYFIRNGFKNNASESSLKFRSFWYVVLTAIILLVGIFTIDSYGNLDIYDYLLEAYNLYIYLGFVAFWVLLESVIKLIGRRRRNKRLIKEEA